MACHAAFEMPLRLEHSFGIPSPPQKIPDDKARALGGLTTEQIEIRRQGPATRLKSSGVESLVSFRIISCIFYVQLLRLSPSPALQALPSGVFTTNTITLHTIQYNYPELGKILENRLGMRYGHEKDAADPVSSPSSGSITTTSGECGCPDGPCTTFGPQTAVRFFLPHLFWLSYKLQEGI